MLTVNTELVTETVEVVTEPITTAEAKAHLKVSISDDDTLIDGIVTAARANAEIHTARSFAQHTYRADIANFHDVIVLPHRPVQSITHIKYFNTDSPEVLTTVDGSVYSLFADRVYRNHGQDWPTAWAIKPNAVQITYVTGYKDQSSPVGVGGSFPKPVKQALHLMIGDMYENREAQFVVFNQIQANPTVRALLDPYRVFL